MPDRRCRKCQSYGFCYFPKECGREEDPVDRDVEVIDTEEALLAVLVYPDGRVRLQSKVTRADGEIDHAWVAETLRRLAAAEEAK